MQYDTTMEAEYWWVIAIAGVMAILFGLVALFWPGLTVLVLVWLFAIYAIITGVVELVAMFRAMGAHHTWWTHLCFGLLGVGAGLVALLWPGMTAVVLLYVIAFWALLIGLTEIIAAFTTGRFLYAIVGLLTVLFGLLLLFNPGTGAVALVMVIGIFAIIRGVILLVEAIRVPMTPAAR